MREIKFRQFYNGRMEHVGFITENGCEFFRGFPNSNRDKFPVMQYTGLKDKNGVEIYEGDIVEITTIDNFTHHPISISKEVVSFNESTARFDNAIHFCGVEVIGNIHQNPELLP